MWRVFAFLLFFLLSPLQILAGVGDTDNRYYVTDEMWAQEPYKKFVHLIPYQEFHRFNETSNSYEPYLVEGGDCSAQHISPNLILSAGHCVKNRYKKYTAKNYKKDEFEIKLIWTPYVGKAEDTLGDWSVWLVTDKKYYSDAYFNPKEPTKTTDVINAGWGWARIFSDEELELLRKIYIDIALTILEENEKLEDKTKEKSIAISDLKKEIYEKFKKPLRDVPNGLKASECKIIFEDCANIKSDLTILENDYFKDEFTEKQKEKIIKNAIKKEGKYNKICNKQESLFKSKIYPNILATTCDSWEGNSGGGYISTDGKYLYGTCSYGSDNFEDKHNTDYIVSAKQFKEKTKELIKEYDSKNPVEENIAKIPENAFHLQPLVPTNNKNRSLDIEIADVEQEINDLKNNLEKKITNIPYMSNEELLSFLDKLVEHDVKKERLEELQREYEEAKAREQSLANRTLTAASIAATGIGGMELARGLSEQNADKAAEQDMDAYIQTMRCTYGNGTQVKAGPERIELPGANNKELMKLRAQYFALAASLKERKAALGLPPGIESEVILDKSQIGLYDDENVGITGGSYESLYRAKALGSESDQQKISEQQSASKKRVVGGGVATGVGTVGGAVGNVIINGDSNENKTKE